MNALTSMQSGRSAWVRGDREGGWEETALSILGLQIAVPYGGGARTYGVPSARLSWLGFMNGF